MIFSSLELLSFVFSTILAFFIVAFFVQGCIYIFRIRSYRARIFLRLLPFLGIVVDIFALKSSLGNLLNPLHCSSCIQKLFLGNFFPDLQSYLSLHQISFLRHLASVIPNSLKVFFGILFVCSSFFLLCRKGFAFRQEHIAIKAIIKSATPFAIPTANSHLNLHGDTRKIKILVSKDALIPFATYSNAIVMPEGILHLPHQELEAIVAHEMQHTLWKDPLVKASLHLFQSLFWWIPLRFWIEMIEEELELASDQELIKQNFPKEFLASAIYKLAVHCKEKKWITICNLVHKKHPLLKRIQAILHHYPKERFTLFGTLAILLGVAFALLCMML